MKMTTTMKMARTTPSGAAAVILVLAAISATFTTDAFATAGSNKRLLNVFNTLRHESAPPAATSYASEEGVGNDIITPALPSWDELSKSNAIRDAAAGDNVDEPFEASSKPLVTLYRDTNGWCPFCERVWLILRAKGIPFDEQLISLQNKPEWYKALVPTTLVPAVLFHGHDGDGKKGRKNERRLVWESSDIIQALEEEFPDTPKMTFDTSEYVAAVKMNDDLTAAGFGFVYAGRNESLTEENKLERKTKFISELDRLDAALEQHQMEGGFFRMGKHFSAVDALMIPTLERWRYQLPLTTDLDIQEGRPALSKWFQAMDSYEPYFGRVAGDEYSWTATTSMFLRYFGGGEDKPQIQATIQRADDAAQRLAGSFAAAAAEQEGGGGNKYSKEAAAKLIANHEAVVKDCTREDPLSQQHISRGSNPNAADAMLRYIASLLLSDNDTMLHSKTAPLFHTDNKEFLQEAADAARIVASRLCVPRDMSAPAARILRAALVIVADRLEE